MRIGDETRLQTTPKGVCFFMEQKKETRRPRALSFKGFIGLLRETASEWSSDKAPRLGAALAYYTVFSIAPLLIIVITIAGLAFDNAETQILSQIQGMLGDKGMETIESMIHAAQKPERSITATTLGFVALIFGAAGVFVQLKDALNTVWDVPEPKAGGLWAFVRKYFLSFTVVLGLGFLMLVALVISAGIAVLSEYIGGMMPGMEVGMKVISFVVSFGLITFLFAMLFKFLPDAKVSWRDVWLGAAFTSLLFVVGKFALGAYLGKAGVASAYGAAGSLALILLWVYYSSQILFFGAEFTEVYARHYGSRTEKAVAKREKRTAKERLVAEIERERRQMAKYLHPVATRTQPRGVVFEPPNRKNL
jgi:membrane protein